MPSGIAPAIRPSKALEKGQTTIEAALAGGLSYTRPPRPGPVPKDSGRIINTQRGRRLLGGDNDRFVRELFASVRIAQTTDSEPGDKDIVKGRFEEGNDSADDGEFEYISTKCYKYSREYKLIAIEYFQTTWKVFKDGLHECIFKRLVVKELKIYCKILRY